MTKEKPNKLEQKTDRECFYYSWGGNIKRGYTTYPREYGARCEFHKEFFKRDEEGILSPNCYSCKHKKYENDKRKNK